MDVFEPLLPIYDVNRGPRFKTTKDDRDWVSVGAPNLDLDLVDPSKRFSASNFSIASPYHAWPDGNIWWAGWIPTSRLKGKDILAWLLPAAPDSAILPANQRYVVSEEWKEQANAIAPRVSSASSHIVKTIPSVFERYLHGRRVPCLPAEYTEGSLEGEEFDSEVDGRAYLATFADEILVNLGFLGWFMTCVPRWDKLIGPEIASFVNELRLPEREKRGFLLDLPLDWPAMDLKLWYENNVPFHYMWTEEAAAQSRFTQLNPDYIKHHRRLARSLERPPTWDELIKDHEEWRSICRVDQYLQDQIDFEGELSTRNPEERHYFVRAHECWYPYHVLNVDLVRRLLDRCYAYFPSFHNLAESNPIWIEGWTGLTICQDVELKDRLDFYGLPRALRECGEVNCRELKKISSAPTPEEMRNKDEREFLAARLLDVHATQLSEKDLQSRFKLAPHRAQERIARGYKEPRLPLSARIKPPLADRLTSPAPQTTPSAEPLARRIGPRMDQTPPADLMEWEAADGSNWSGSGESAAVPPSEDDTTAAAPSAPRGRGRDAPRARGYRAADVSGPLRPSGQRRSASPPRAFASRDGPSSSSSSSRVARIRPIEPGNDGIIALPNPSGRRSQIARFDSAEWRTSLRQLEYELEALCAKTSPLPCLPEIREKFEALYWSPTFIRYGYIKAKMPCNQVRLWAWGADKRAHDHPRDVLCRFLATGRPAHLCMPESMLPAIAPPEALNQAEVGHEIQPLTMTREMTLQQLAKLYMNGLDTLAKKPHAGAFAGLGGAASFVVRRFMWREVSARIGSGPCRETTIRHGGKRGLVSDGSTVYYDFGKDCERSCIEGKVLYPADGERHSGVRHYFPPYHVYFADSRESYGEWNEWDEDYCQNIAEAIENGVAEPKTDAEWRKILNRDRVRTLEHKQMVHIIHNRLSGKDARLWATYLARIHRLDVPEFRRVDTLLDSLEPRFLLKA